MIVEDIVKYLNGRGYDAYAERPEKMPSEFLIVEQLSGINENKLKGARIAVQSHSGSLYGAMELNERVIDAMNDIVSTYNISSCKLEGSYNYTLTAGKQYRYQSIFNLHYYN